MKGNRCPEFVGVNQNCMRPCETIKDFPSCYLGAHSMMPIQDTQGPPTLLVVIRSVLNLGTYILITTVPLKVNYMKHIGRF